MSLKSELEDISNLQSNIKRLGSIYQLGAKLTVADYYKKSLADVDLPFPLWMELRRQYERDSGLKL